MKRFSLLIITLAVCYIAGAQDRAVFNQYQITPVLINPAATGFYDQHRIQFHARAQWTGFPDAPKTMGALYDGSIGSNFGLGVGIFAEKADNLTDLRGVLNYAFRFDIGENAKLSIGSSIEYFQRTLSASVRDGNFYEPDQVVDDAVQGRRTVDAALGLFSTIYEKTFIGLAFTNLVGQRLDNISGSQSSSGSFFSRYTFLVGHQFDITDMNFSLEPSVMLRQTLDSPFMVDFNVKAGFLEDKLLAGLSYRTLGSIGVLLGTRLESFQLYYTYDASIQQIQKYNNGTHEVTVAFRFDRNKDNRIRRNPYSSRR